MAETMAAGSTAAPGVFSRKASGLVRVGNSLDVFIFNVGLVSVGIAIAYNQFYGPSLYPGAQPWISTLSGRCLSTTRCFTGGRMLPSPPGCSGSAR